LISFTNRDSVLVSNEVRSERFQRLFLALRPVAGRIAHAYFCGILAFQVDVKLWRLEMALRERDRDIKRIEGARIDPALIAHQRNDWTHDQSGGNADNCLPPHT